MRQLLPLLVRDALQEGRARLEAVGVPESGLEAAVLLAHVLHRSRGSLHADPSAPLSRAQAAGYLALVQRRCYREPTAYITGRKSWWDLELEVNRNDLIPRPETELLADLAIRITREGALAAPAVADVGTGSGALAIAIARALPHAIIYALDNAKGALRTAQRNAGALAPGRVYVLESELIDALPVRAQIVVANLPYIPSADIEGLAPEIAFEPRGALDGGRDGLRPIAALLQRVAGWSAAPLAILLECGHDQTPAIRSIVWELWPSASVTTYRDLAGVERVVVIRPWHTEMMLLEDAASGHQ
jgi:release factor glutamine methyltransferase